MADGDRTSMTPDSERPETAQAPSGTGRMARSTAFFSFAMGVSRIAGLVREVVVASYFGVTAAMSAFTIAFQIPNLVRALFGDMALQGAFVPSSPSCSRRARRRRRSASRRASSS